MKQVIILLTVLFISSYNSKAQDSLNYKDENGLKQGKWKEFFQDEKFDYAIINYVDDVKEGPFKAFLEDGTLYMEGSYSDGELNREVLIYYTTGDIKMKIHYSDGKKNGKKLVFYENGTLYSETEYKDDLLHGSTITYHPNGRIKRESYYLNDEKTGTWKKYSEDGKLIRSDEF